MEELRYHNKTPYAMRASVLWLSGGAQKVVEKVLLSSEKFWAPTVPRCSLDGEWL